MTDSRSSHSTFSQISAANATSDVHTGVVSVHSQQRAQSKEKCGIISIIFAKIPKLTLMLPVVLTEIPAGGGGRNSEYAYL